MQTCKLCGEQRPLRKSHIVPKFVSAWIKKTALSPFLRDLSAEGARVQDTLRLRLLCSRCETRISAWEGRFQREIFGPLQDSLRSDGFEARLRGHTYGQWLLSFVVSLGWRALFVDGGLSPKDAALRPAFERAEVAWRSFLLDAAPDPGPFSHHLLFLGFTPSARGLSANELFALNWYVLRAIDLQLLVNPVTGELHTYAKLPGIVMCSAIQPDELHGWNNTRLALRGSLSFPRTVIDPRFRSFFFEQAHRLAVAGQMTPRQQERLRQSLLADPARLYQSWSIDLYLRQHLEPTDADPKRGA